MIYSMIVTTADSPYTDGYETNQEIGVTVSVNNNGVLSLWFVREEGDTGAFDKHKIYAPGAWSEVWIEPITEDADE